jgi:L-asparagine transporter-like permease
LAIAVAGNLTLGEIIGSQDFALAEAARPAYGDAGVWATTTIAIVATASGVTVSVFAASRMLAMLTHMKEVPHRHFGLPWSLRTHAMIHTIAFAMALTVLFDLRRIAALGAVFYLLMDIADSLILYVSVGGVVAIIVGERLFMWSHTDRTGNMDMSA